MPRSPAIPLVPSVPPVPPFLPTEQTCAKINVCRLVRVISVALKPPRDRANAIRFIDLQIHGACYVDEFVTSILGSFDIDSYTQSASHVHSRKLESHWGICYETFGRQAATE